ncbi:MAG: ComF family protein [Desulfomonilaceae bacterium]|nr:ComF family protein [Desulfomonilaceae bacterium]
MEKLRQAARDPGRVIRIFGRGLSALVRAASDLAFPASCAFCGEPLSEPSLSLCADCCDRVGRIDAPFCDRCGRSFDGLQTNGHVCGSCMVKPPPYGKARYAVRYEGDFRKAFIDFKFHGALHLGNVLSRFLTEAYQSHFAGSPVDVIVPVPLHPKRLCARGHNQVVILGEKLSRASGIPLARTCLEKTHNRQPQVGLSRRERAVNVRGSFRTARAGMIAGRKILLIDDVATTGATVTEAAKTMMRSGASRVDVLVLALRPLFSHGPAGPEADGANV